MADTTSNTPEKKKDSFVDIETEESIQTLRKWASKTTFVSSPFVYLFLPWHTSEDYFSQFEDLISSSGEYLEDVIAKSPETFDILKEKLPEVLELANEGNFEEAAKTLRSLPVIGEFLGDLIDEFDLNDFNEVYDYVQSLLEN
ncbi:hypothetical protein Anas_14470 [Armadillidium nasatum]|uniref:Uncharacterized protein n=1 Tax=Armadillidium nasatum TaxID=96803 RepID=A0A5N5T7B9_9CRUS|nr:hypothetical protein Anas_14470 [Armadillidium nasatum]